MGRADGTIIAGHGRVLGARRLGLAEVPVMVAAGWSDAQKKAYAIADNKLSLNAGWDEEILGPELGELEVLGFDVDLIGFSEAERRAMEQIARGGGTAVKALESSSLSCAKVLIRLRKDGTQLQPGAVDACLSQSQ